MPARFLPWLLLAGAPLLKVINLERILENSGQGNFRIREVPAGTALAAAGLVALTIVGTIACSSLWK